MNLLHPFFWDTLYTDLKMNDQNNSRFTINTPRRLMCLTIVIWSQKLLAVVLPCCDWSVFPPLAVIYRAAPALSLKLVTAYYIILRSSSKALSSISIWARASLSLCPLLPPPPTLTLLSCFSAPCGQIWASEDIFFIVLNLRKPNLRFSSSQLSGCHSRSSHFYYFFF